jgi:hypothetical protein
VNQIIIDPNFYRIRERAIEKLREAFPGDADAIRAFADMNPMAMPRLIAVNDKGEEIINPIFRPDLKWRVVWDKVELKEIT